MSAEKLRPLLIVEDDPALQKQIRWAFDNYETLTADDRESALALVRVKISLTKAKTLWRYFKQLVVFNEVNTLFKT